MKATLIFDLVLVAMAALLISLEYPGDAAEDSPFQNEPIVGRLPARAIPACLLRPNCQR